jgi:hypothetical protein
MIKALIENNELTYIHVFFRYVGPYFGTLTYSLNDQMRLYMT